MNPFRRDDRPTHVALFPLILLSLILMAGAGSALAGITLKGQLDPNSSRQKSDVWGWVHPTTGFEYAIVGTRNGGEVYMMNVEDPADPVLISTITTQFSDTGFDMKTWDHYLYIVDGNGSGQDSEIWDIQNPALPVQVGNFQSGHNIFIDDQGFMFNEVTGITIFDVASNPTAPDSIWHGGVEGHDATVIGDLLYDAHGASGTFIYDVTNRAAPILLGGLAQGNDGDIGYHHNAWPSTDGNTLFITDEFAQSLESDFYAFDISDPANFVQIGQYNDLDATVHNVYVLGDHLFVSYYTAGFRVFDIADPSAIALCDEFDTSALAGQGFAGAWGCYPYLPSGNILVSDIDNGLFVFEFTIVPGECQIPDAIVLTAINPQEIFAGETLDFIITGDGLDRPLVVSLGAAATVQSTTTISADSLMVSALGSSFATPGVYDVVAADGSTADTLVSAFTLLASTTHYVSPSGGNVFPYARTVDAALTLNDALFASVAGDTIAVDSTTLSGVDVAITTLSRVILGGWTDGFTLRGARTTLNTTGSGVRIQQNQIVFDGFTLRNGPAMTVNSVNDIDISNCGFENCSGTVGGGLAIILANTVNVRDCQFSGCTAGSGGAIGLQVSTANVENCELFSNSATIGGGIYFASGSGVISDCHIHDNSAVTRGGGVSIFINSGGVTLSGNTVENNSVASGGEGAGIAGFLNSSVLMLTDNAIRNNTGADRGGGVWVTESILEISGGAVSSHSVAFDGAGLYADSSTVTVDEVLFQGNSAGSVGGGVAIVAGENQSGVLVGKPVIRHSVFDGNAAGTMGSAVLASGSNLPNGEVIGNTIYNSQSLGADGAVHLANVNGALFNNIVANTTGDGIVCVGGNVTASYNLVWSSSGSDYTGCVPGVGARFADPLFVDAVASDFHLALHSPAIDAGNPDPTYDDPDGGRGDLGRFGSHSFVQDHPAFPKNVVATTVGGNIDVTWLAGPEGDIDFYAVYCDTVASFVPSALTLVTTTTDTTATIPALVDTTFYIISAVDSDGYAGGYSIVTAADPSAATGVDQPIPYINSLAQNSPNPFNPSTLIRFSVADFSQVSLTIFDVSGRRIRVLVNESMPAGLYDVRWGGRDDRGNQVASGVYFYRIQSGSFLETRKMILLK